MSVTDVTLTISSNALAKIFHDKLHALGEVKSTLKFSGFDFFRRTNNLSQGPWLVLH